MVVSWNLKRPGRCQWDSILEQLEMGEAWDAVLWQESLAPSSDEAQQFDFGDDQVVSSAVRGHTIFMAPTGIATELHRNSASAIQAVIAGDCFRGRSLRDLVQGMSARMHIGASARQKAPR